LGDAYTMRDTTVGGDDFIIGGTGSTDNYLSGDATEMIGHSTGGDDVVQAHGGGTNQLYGDAQGVYVADGDVVTGGNDMLMASDDGATNQDSLFGDAGSVLDSGWFGAGTFICGDDLIVAGTGNDVMFGDVGSAALAVTVVGGADTFEFNGGIWGADQIRDFVKGTDLIEILNVDTNDIQVTTILFEGSISSTEISFAGGGSVVVVGVPDLVLGDLIFS
jgi:hypothetical protein